MCKESHRYHAMHTETKIHTVINCPYCRKLTYWDFYEKINENLLIDCIKCSRHFSLGKHKKDASRRRP